jgi:hypothetical protein
LTLPPRSLPVIPFRSYEASTIRELVSSFQEQISRFLLFLRNVDRIEVYVHEPGGSPEGTTRMLYRAHRAFLGGQGKARWNALNTFMMGTPQAPLSKEAFYARLQSTPEKQLPQVRARRAGVLGQGRGPCVI